MCSNTNIPNRLEGGLVFDWPTAMLRPVWTCFRFPVPIPSYQSICSIHIVIPGRNWKFLWYNTISIFPVSHLRVFSESFPMNTKIAEFRWCIKNLYVLVLLTKVAKASQSIVLASRAFGCPLDTNPQKSPLRTPKIFVRNFFKCQFQEYELFFTSMLYEDIMPNFNK